MPADLDFLVGIYAFGAMLAFTIAHLSIIRLRYREPERDRPYRVPLSVRVRGGSLPLPAVVGALLSAPAGSRVVVLHEGARYVGLAWLLGGLALYVAYRRSDGNPLLKRVTVPERALRREPPRSEFGSLLVPIFGKPLDDDIVQTAGRLAGEVRDDLDEEGATIEAIWVFEMPMSLPIDARLPEAQLRRAQEALRRAKAVGEEYEGVHVATAMVRARRAGEAIVREARRRGVEAIVLAAEEPSRVRGGALFGGSGGPLDNYVGEVTKYVLRKARLPGDPDRPGRRAAARRSAGRAGRRRGNLPAMFILVVGAGRVGSAVAKRALQAGHEVSVLDEDPLSHEQLDKDLAETLGGRRRPLHRRHRARGRRADRGGDRAGRRVHRLDERRQHEPRDRADRPAALRRPARRRARARPGARRLVRRAGPAHDLPDAARDRHGRAGRARRRRSHERTAACT